MLTDDVSDIKVKKIGFQNKLRTRKLPNFHKEGKWYQLQEPLCFFDGDKDYIVPTGFITDFATVPKCLQWLYKPNGKYTRSAVLHDYLYITPMNRKEADKIFHKAMITDGVSEFTADIFYRAVRWFGGLYR